ncbi:MAG: PQQ-dependent dehydrogenase, methanol/ethanol family [Gammaproteobacteria bacterium]|nr:PQQ-dependent dehydrogenase, methanol/ethanol family [Gammaproteobacteria bacterium]
MHIHSRASAPAHRRYALNRSLLGLLAAGILAACSTEQDAAGSGATDPAGADQAQVAGDSRNAVQPVDAARITGAADNNSDWLTHGRTYSEARNSPLDQINRATVADLGMAWDFELDTDRGQEATPLVIDGVVYLTSAWSKAFAVDARTGEEIWRYDPEVPREYAANACCDVVNRGMAAWGDKVYFGALDGRLIALDRATGDVAWSVVTADPEQRYTITGAPRIVDGKVIIGNGGGELGVRGYVSAYDAETGDMVWRFYTVPGNPADGFENAAMEMAAETWAGEWWQIGGGGTAWDSMAYDPELDLLYVGVGNGSPWNHEIRSDGQGDNLFLSSIVALRPDTGEYVWHFQTTPAESWDYTATQHMILADLEIDGELREVIMQAPKNGFFYVIDRATGEFISGENYVEINWASGLDAVTGRPIEAEVVRYQRDPAVVIPGPLGGHNWYPMSFDADTGLVYIPTQNTSYVYSNPAEFVEQSVGWNLGLDAAPGQPVNPEEAERVMQMSPSALLAWDPVTQREVWRVNYPVYGNSGLLSTGGGLVFQGSADGFFHAYTTDTGEHLWSHEVGDAILGGPVTYELDGEQYVLALAGQGGAIPLTMGLLSGNYPRERNGRLMAFKLGADMQSPVVMATPREPLDVSGAQSDGDADYGAIMYGAYCSVCHGPAALSSGPLPDLRYTPMMLTEAGFASIVLEGSLSSRGMPGFGADIGPAEAEGIRAYLLELAASVAN